MNNTITALDLTAGFSTSASDCVLMTAQNLYFGTAVSVSAHKGIEATAKGATEFSAALEVKITADTAKGPGINRTLDLYYGFLNGSVTPSSTVNIANTLHKLTLRLNPNVSASTTTDTYYRFDIKKTGPYLYVAHSHPALDNALKMLVTYTY